jgi:4-amino-4-deoxy-L-arabinose transferase-like glycosyltransferase
MLQSGDYLVPRIGTELRTQKPPLFYWIACAAAKLHGSQTLVTHRIPSVLAAFGVLFLVLQWCRQLGFSHAQKFFALCSLATTYRFIVHARRGSFEMPLTFFCSLALYALYQLNNGFRWRYAAIAAVCFGLGFLTKATPVFLFVPLPFAAWLLLQKRLKPVLSDWRFYALFVLAMLIGLSWYAVIMQRVPEARRIITGEALLPLGVEDEEVKTATHYAMPWFFLLGIWRTAFPISLLLPLIVRDAWKQRGFQASSASRLMLLGIGLPFIVFSAIPQKQDHYMLPVFPLIALLGTQVAGAALQRPSRFAFNWMRFAEWLLLVIVLATAAASGFAMRVIADYPVGLAILAALAIAATGFAAVPNLVRGRFGPAVFPLLAGVFLVMVCYFTLVRPIEDGFHSGQIFLTKKYNQQAWDQKFSRYPWLRTALKVEKGESRLDHKRRREQKLHDPNRPRKKKDSGHTS